MSLVGLDLGSNTPPFRGLNDTTYGQIERINVTLIRLTWVPGNVDEGNKALHCSNLGGLVVRCAKQLNRADDVIGRASRFNHLFGSDADYCAHKSERLDLMCLPSSTPGHDRFLDLLRHVVGANVALPLRKYHTECNNFVVAIVLVAFVFETDRARCRALRRRSLFFSILTIEFCQMRGRLPKLLPRSLSRGSGDARVIAPGLEIGDVTLDE